MASRGKGAAASHQAAEEGANLALADRGNAIDAVVSAFLTAAAVDPAVLFAPLGVMVAGVGVGARWFDGRSCQPGRGLPRPRGFVGEPAPAAFAAAPRSLAAVALVSAYGGARPFGSHARRAATLAQKRGAARRAALFTAIGRQGPSVLHTSDTMRALLAAAGPPAGGLLSEADLRDTLPSDERARFQERRGVGIALPPVHGRRRMAHVVVAADGSGLVAALAFNPDGEGIPVPELEVELPRDATPVRRGVTRVSPGTALEAALPIALLRRRADPWFAAVGVRTDAPLEMPEAGEGLPDYLEGWRKGGVALAATTERRRVQLTRLSLERAS